MGWGRVNDQAARLRLVSRDTTPFLAAEGGPATPALVVGSGKGGVGKSLIAIGMSAALAARGRKVLLVDGDQNLGNLHVLLGVRPVLTPASLLHDAATPEELLIAVATNLWLLPADSGSESMHGLGATDRARLHRRMTTVYRNFDTVIVDAAAGLDSALRCVSLHATRLVVVTVPEATALTDAYALMKIVHGRLPSLPLDVVVNSVRGEHDGTTAYARLAEAAQRFLNRTPRYLGSVPEDATLRGVASTPHRLLGPAEGGMALSAIARIALEELDAPVPASVAAVS
jgi:flagellar biosynthesis protein FlhG